MKDYMKEHAAFVSFTTDGWSSRTGRQYVGVTAHFINKEYQLVTFCLGVKHMNGQFVLRLHRHEVSAEDSTAENLYDYFVRLFTSFGILDKVVAGTTDNGANYVAAVNKNQNWVSVHCVVHTLQLAVNDVLKVGCCLCAKPDQSSGIQSALG